MARQFLFLKFATAAVERRSDQNVNGSENFRDDLTSIVFFCPLIQSGPLMRIITASDFSKQANGPRCIYAGRKKII